jgi:hypothetical protein
MRPVRPGTLMMTVKSDLALIPRRQEADKPSITWEVTMHAAILGTVAVALIAWPLGRWRANVWLKANMPARNEDGKHLNFKAKTPEKVYRLED